MNDAPAARRDPGAAASPLGLFAGDSEMARRMRSHAWAETPLGPPETWPQNLRTDVSILINSRYSMFVFWGRHFVKIRNDGYRPITGHKPNAAVVQ